MREVERAVVGERRYGGEADEGRVRVEKPGAARGGEVGEEGLEEPPLRVERHPAEHVAEDRAEREGEERARDRVDAVPERRPWRAREVMAQLDRAGAPDQEPRDDHDGQRVVSQRNEHADA